MKFRWSILIAPLIPALMAASCNPSDFSVSPSAPSLSVARGASATVQISITPANGYNLPVTLAASGLPNGATASFSPVSISPGTTATLTINASGSADLVTGKVVTITGQGDGKTKTTGLNLSITDGTTPPSTTPFATEAPGVATEEPSKLLLALPIKNIGLNPVSNVQVQSVILESAIPLAPVTLPVNLGTLQPGGTGVFEASFSAAGLTAGTQYRLKLRGSFGTGGQAAGFDLEWLVGLPPRASEVFDSATATADPLFAEGGQNPSTPIREDPDERNKVALPPIPTSTLGGEPQPTNPATEVQPLTLASGTQSGGVRTLDTSNPTVFLKNTHLGNQVSFNGSPPDMSGASSDNLVFLSGNTFGAYATDGGNTFTSLDITKIFPSAPTADSGGLCCDQVVQYVPKIDRFVWLIQDWPNTAGNSNKVRLAAASPAEIINSKGTLWTYWNLTSATFKLGTWMDYPDLCVGKNFLYLSVNAVGKGRLVVRIPLSQIQNRQTVNMNYIVTPKGGSVTQNTDDEAFWASNNTNRQMRIYSWKEASGQVFQHDVNLKPWPNNLTTGYSSKTPDGTNWLASANTFPGHVTGATRVSALSDELWFAWAGTAGGGFAQPQVQLANIALPGYTLIKQQQFWNPSYAFAYPALATNNAYEVGVSLAWGGGSLYGNHAVGILGDSLYTTGNSDGAGDRWGDYVAVRQHAPKGGLFSAVGYAVRLIDPKQSASCSQSPGCRFDPVYTLFGHNSAINPPPPPN